MVTLTASESIFYSLYIFLFVVENETIEHIDFSWNHFRLKSATSICHAFAVFISILCAFVVLQSINHIELEAVPIQTAAISWSYVVMVACSM